MVKKMVVMLVISLADVLANGHLVDQMVDPMVAESADLLVVLMGV